MTILHKTILLIIYTAGIFTLGYYAGKGDKEVQIVEKVITKEGETKTVYKDRIVTVTKVVKPDGTTTETTRTEEKEGTKETKRTEVASNKDTKSTPILPKYSVAGGLLQGIYTLSRLHFRPDYYITGGYRVLGPTWLEIGSNTKEELTLGVRIEL